MTQVVYKLRHIPTGLYFEPKGCTVNASVDGRVYNRKPPRQRFWGISNDLKGKFKEHYHPTALEDWEVVEFELTERVMEEK